MMDIIKRIEAKKRNATEEEDDAAEEIVKLRAKVAELEKDTEWRSKATTLITNLNVVNKSFDQREYVATLDCLFSLAMAE
jgi:hypothetical protein